MQMSVVLLGLSSGLQLGRERYASGVIQLAGMCWMGALWRLNRVSPRHFRLMCAKGPTLTKPRSQINSLLMTDASHQKKNY